MAKTHLSNGNNLPLLAWPEHAEILRLEALRIALQDKIKKTKKGSHKELILQDRLKELTLQELRLISNRKERGHA